MEQTGLIKGLNRIRGIVLISQIRGTVKGQWKILVVKGGHFTPKRGQTAFPSKRPTLKGAAE